MDNRVKQYAIKVPFGDGWLYVTEGSGNDPKVVTYDDLGLACDARNVWGPRAQVVEYKEPCPECGMTGVHKMSCVLVVDKDGNIVSGKNEN